MNKYLRQLFTAVVALLVFLGLSCCLVMGVLGNELYMVPGLGVWV